MQIVGIVDDSTALAGQPNVFLTVEGAQQMGYSGQPIVTSVGIRGTPARGTRRLSHHRPRRERSTT